MNEVKSPLISIITLNLNQTNITCQFLESTRKLNYKNFEILVCDMGSTIDPTHQINAGNYPNTTVFRSEVNLGFTGGNNWGMRHAKGDYVFIVNNDTEVTPELLERLLEPFTRHEEIGVVCPKIMYYHRPNVIQYAGFTPINVLTGRNKSIGWGQEDMGQHDVPAFTSFAHGAAMMVSRKVIDKVGMFPEKFFLYYEEMDWSRRITNAGYKIYYQPLGKIYHKESLTVGRQSPIKVYYQTRNRILYMRRNTNFMQFSVFIVFFTLVSTPKAISKYLISRQHEHLMSFMKGVAWNFTTSKYSPV